MSPIKFKECNSNFGAPPGFSESQIKTIPAFCGQIKSNSLDGAMVTVVAWKPNEEDIEKIKEGEPIYISMLGGLSPHYLSMSFESATNPS